MWVTLLQDHGPLSERAVALIGYEVLKVVKACHDHGILHGDVKPANFVLKHRTRNPLYSADINLLFAPWMRAIDFGCSQFLGSKRFTKRTGTPVYMAPEIFERNYYSEADMWSVGMMLYQLYARRFPYWPTYEACKNAKLEEVSTLVQEAPLTFDYGPWKHMSAEGLDFIQQCLERDCTARMTVNEAMDHSWFDQWLPQDELGIVSMETVDDEPDDMPSGFGRLVTNNIVPGLLPAAAAQLLPPAPAAAGAQKRMAPL